MLGKLFARLDHKGSTACSTNWIDTLSDFTEGGVVAIDGKTIRKSDKAKAPKSALHVVPAYAAGNRLCLGQEVVPEKSNGITAIPKLLQLLELKGRIVTIDAMGCQKRTAKEIIKKGADYLLMVKGNQQGLKGQVEKLFEITEVSGSDTNIDSGPGRVETRK